MIVLDVLLGDGLEEPVCFGLMGRRTGRVEDGREGNTGKREVVRSSVNSCLARINFLDVGAHS